MELQQALTAANITTTDADLGWTAGGTETQWNVEYGANGFTLGTGTLSSSVTTNPYSITGLNSSTSYDFYVQADCGGAGTSSWAGPFTFTTSFACPAGAECATLSSDVSTDIGFTVLGGASTCPGSLSVTIPAGDVIDSVTTFYDMTAASGAYMSEQRSWLYSPTISAGEAAVASGTGFTGGTLSYNRSTISFANAASGTVDFELHAGRTWGGTGCDNVYNKVDAGTWTIVVYHSLAPSCFDPTALNVTGLTATDANLGWTAGGTETIWNVEYGPTGYTPGTGTLLNGVTTNPLSITGLTATNSYDFYVQADCGSSVSNRVGPYTFTTPCNAVSAMPYVQDFDALTPNNAALSGCQAADNITDCWFNDLANTNNWVARSAATGSTGTGPSADHTGGGNYAFLETSGCNGVTSYLHSVGMDISALTSPEMRFWYHLYGTDMGSLTVEVSTDAGATWSGSLWNQAGDQGDQWREVTVDLSTYVGATNLIVRFEGISGIGFTSDMAIDDFLIQEAPSCPDPLALTISNITGTSADANWLAGGTETAWNFEYGPSGYVQGSGTYTGALSTTSNNISGLSSNSSYDVYVQADCGTDSSIWVGPISFTTLIQGAVGVTCSSGSAGFALDDDLEGNIGWTGDLGPGNGLWNFGSGGTGSGGTGPSAAHSNLGYVYFEGSTGGLDTASIVSPAIDLTAATSDAELSFWMHAYGADMGELAVSVGTSPTGPFNVVFLQSGPLQTLDTDPWTNVGVNLGTYVGQTIYLQLTFYRLNTGFTTDMAIDLIQVESCFSCVAPSNLMASNLTTTSADISWTAGGSETSWNVVTDTVGFNPYAATNIVAANDSLSVSGLTLNTCYEFYVQADCGGGDTSAWVGPYSFCTLPAPVCYYLLDMQDSYGDGWNGASIDVSINGIASGSYQIDQILGGQLDLQQTDTVYAYTGDVVDFSFTSGAWDTEITFQIYDPLGIQLGSYGTSPAVGLFLTDSSSNSICAPPLDDLGALSVTTDISSGCEISFALLTMDIYNYGVASQTGFDVSYSVNGGANQVTETVSGTILPGDTITYTFTQPLDVSADGLYCIDVATLLVGDLDVTNDEIIGSYCVENYLTPEDPIGTSDTICEGSGDTLTLSATSNGNITWYDAATGGNVVGTGNDLTAYDNSTTTYYAEAVANIADTLASTYDGGNGCGFGNMFDVIATTDLTIDSMRGHFNAADSVKVYYKTGSYIGSEEVPGDWTLLGSAEINSSATAFEALVFSVGQLSLTAGDTVGIYVQASVRYTNVTAGTTYSNSDMTIAGGTGLCASFATTFSPRMWNGTIFYSTGGCSSDRTAVDAVVEDCTNILEIGLDEFSLFPNPNNGDFTLLNAGVANNIDVTITDIQGKVVYSKNHNFNKNEQKTLTLEGIERGLYLVHLNSDDGLKIINMIVQ